MGRGSDRSLIGKVMTNYMECPMRGEGWSLEIDVPPHAMLIPVWDEWKISLESSRYMPAADQPGPALCRKKQKSQSNAGKKTDFLAWRSLRKKVLWKRFKIVRSPPWRLASISPQWLRWFPFPRKKIHVRPPDHCLIGMLMQDLPAVPWKLPSPLGSALMKDLR